MKATGQGGVFRCVSLGALILVLALAGTASRQSLAEPPHAQPATTPAIAEPEQGPFQRNIEIKVPQQRDVVLRAAKRRTIELPGQVEPSEQTSLYASVSGAVQTVHADIGDRVKKGQVLAELSVPQISEELKRRQALLAQAEAEVEQAQAAVRATEAALVSAKAQVRETEAGLKSAQAGAARHKAQFERLEKQAQVIDKETLAEARHQLGAAVAAVQGAEAKVRAVEATQTEGAARRAKAEAGLKVARALLEVARVDVQRVQVLRGHAQVRAPFDGVVSRRGATTGMLTGPARRGDMGPLFVVVRTGPVRVAVQVPESAATVVRAGDRVMVRVPALKQELAAKVTRTAGALDPRTRTLRAEIDLPNAEGKLLPGMYVTVALTVAGEGPKKEEAPKPAAKDADELKALAQARLDAAHKAYDEAMKGLHQTRRTGTLILPVTKPEDVYAWSVRWLNAERNMGGKNDDRPPALEAHLRRMKELQQRVTEMSRSGLLSPPDASAVEFYRVEAELWLARGRAK
jgi:multidrug efflux pump subunit AcrA (membrane-fusion protein)